MNRLKLAIVLWQQTRGLSFYKRLRHVWYLSALIDILQKGMKQRIAEKQTAHGN